MIQIINQTHGISIAGNNFPKNSLSFEPIGNNVSISDLSGNILYNAPYSEYMNSSNVPYTSTAAVISDLSNSYSS